MTSKAIQRATPSPSGETITLFDSWLAADGPVALRLRHQSQVLERPGGAVPVLLRAVEGQPLLVERRRSRIVALRLRHEAEPIEPQGDPIGLPHFPVQGHGLLGQRYRALEVAPHVLETP